MAALELKLTEEDIQAVRHAAEKADKVKVGDRVCAFRDHDTKHPLILM